jgi:hypothetical protein
MSFGLRGEAVVGAHSLEDLKTVYRVLHRRLKQQPELMDCDFLIELQDFLHRQATREGIDGTDHGAWDAWLSRPSASSWTGKRSH